MAHCRLSLAAPPLPQCLVGADGSALLHRVSRLNDPDITEQVRRAGGCQFGWVLLWLASPLWSLLAAAARRPHQLPLSTSAHTAGGAGHLCLHR